MIRTLALLLLLIPTAAFSFQNEPNGFNNIPWDTPISKIAGLRPSGEAAGTIRRYMKMDETLLFEGVELADIIYSADGGKLVRVELTFDCVQRGNMFKALNMKYGVVSKTAPKEKTMIWQGKVTTVTFPPPVVVPAAPPAKNAEPPLCTLIFESTAHLPKSAPQQPGK